MVGTLPSTAGGASSIPGWGTGVLHASWPRNQNLRNRSNVVPSSVKIFKKKETINQGHERYKSLDDQKIQVPMKYLAIAIEGKNIL